MGMPMRLSSGRFGFRYDDQRRAHRTLVKEIALLEHVDHGVRLAVGFDGTDGLMFVRVEFFAERVDFAYVGALEGGDELLERQFDPLFEGLEGGVLGGERGLDCP